MQSVPKILGTLRSESILSGEICYSLAPSKTLNLRVSANELISYALNADGFGWAELTVKSSSCLCQYNTSRRSFQRRPMGVETPVAQVMGVDA